MDGQQIANATAAWVEAWLHGNARPQLVIQSLERLGTLHGTDVQARAILERAWRVVASTPFGSVSESFAV
ncbi:MAG TPA: hypothetical protein VH482_10505 [Thermomicrobiales bacterium]|jgi:hypothetical protein